jgi:tungstate transport system substrate-binding protein
MKPHRFFVLGAAVLALAALTQAADERPVILATTTSTQDSGLLDVLVPMFEKKTGVQVKTVAIGTGQALALGARGEADVVLCHAPDLEKKYVADGSMIDRRAVMHNDFVFVGPAADPAHVRGTEQAVAVLKKIADAKATFVSRGDNSGTDILEKKLWKGSGVDPKGAPWYLEAGQGMGATLRLASEKRAYTLSDRGTYLAQRKTLELDILFQGDPELRNAYHVMLVNPAKFPKVNHSGAKAFADFLVSAEVQDVIRDFGREKFGEPLFFPDAGMREAAD